MSDREVAMRILHMLGVESSRVALDALTTFLGNVREQHERDRSATIEACAQIAFSWDIDWSVGIAENLGRVGLAIRALNTRKAP